MNPAFGNHLKGHDYSTISSPANDCLAVAVCCTRREHSPMEKTDITIRRATDADWPQIWQIVQDVIRRGKTFPQARNLGEGAAFDYWMSQPTATYIALLDDRVAGTYYIKPNQAAAGAHVCNAGYMVAEDRRRRGIGRALCRHSLAEAAALGFMAMQFNLVVSTNTASIRLWQSMGFQIVGTLPRAFHHPDLGLVDAHIMYRCIDSETRVPGGTP
jgi:L-amino acid N-acyltransferase YncA